MNAARPAEILRQLEHTGAADAELLARFVSTGDGAAFAELVRRHGELVLGVCRRVTGHPQDAEDAFQATFLVLARRAGALRHGVRLWSWLYGVAYRVAWRARRSAARRRKHEVTVAVFPEPSAPPERPVTASELLPILDEELSALPLLYREAIVWCDLRGASREEAAAALGVPEGTLSSRLASGRKKLAARLTRRGVSLSVAALSGAIAEARAGTTVPAELVTATCGLVADCAAGRPVPGALARLVEGRTLVRKLLVFGVLLAAVAGAVLAAAARDLGAPPPPPQAPRVAERFAEPQPKSAPDRQPAEEHGAPHIAAGWDVPLGDARRVVWSATGSRLAVAGRRPNMGKGAGNSGGVVLMKYSGKAEPEDVTLLYLLHAGDLVGFSPDGTNLITDRRESALLSGLHQLVYWDPQQKKLPQPQRGPGWGGGGIWGSGELPFLFDEAKLRTVTFDGAGVEGYAFAPDGKTFRAVRTQLDGDPPRATCEVIEINTESGRASKPLYQFDKVPHALSPDGKRLAIGDTTAPTVRVYDLDNRAKPELWRYTFTGETVPLDNEWKALVFSPDGNRLVVSYGYADPVVLNVQTGKPTSSLGSYQLFGSVYWSRPSFSSDGRLLASLCYSLGKKKVQISPNGKERLVIEKERRLLTVWDTATGRVLKSWPVSGNNTPFPAFHPSRPLLVIAEPNGDEATRLGFWDFAAEPKKK
jgi:RNA polymerase sigma factor (sigma-70 family)